MGMMYAAVFSSVAVTAQQDFFELNAPSTAIWIVHSVEITQSTDVGDAAAEGLAILHKRGATTSGSGGTAPTPTPLEQGFAAAGGSVEVNNTTKATSGTIVTLHSSNWIIQQPYLWLPTPEMRHVISPSGRYTVELATTPADSITCSGTIVFEQIGT
jgi:hypothetical protein